MERATKWSVTINMKTAISQQTAEHCIATARQQGWSVIGQIERGEQGTKHFQLAVATPQVRFSAVKKMFPGAHIEVAKDWSALLKYCQKEDTRVEKLVENKFISFQIVRDKFAEFILTTTYAEEKFPLTDETKMVCWDNFICHSIEQGIECDLIGVNPQYRSCIMKYWSAYLTNAVRRQTDRQTQEVLVPTISIPQDGLEETNDSEEEDGSTSPRSDGSGSSSPF